MPLNFEVYVNFEDLFLFQNGLFLFHWHHLAISTLVSVSLSWSLSWHHYDTYSCCSICLQKPVRGDWVGWWTVFCPYSLEGRPVQSCVRSDLYLRSAQAIFFFITVLGIASKAERSSNTLTEIPIHSFYFFLPVSSWFSQYITISPFYCSFFFQFQSSMLSGSNVT